MRPQGTHEKFGVWRWDYFTAAFWSVQERIRTGDRVTPIEAHSQGKIIEPY